MVSMFMTVPYKYTALRKGPYITNNSILYFKLMIICRLLYFFFFSSRLGSLSRITNLHRDLNNKKSH